MSNVTRHTLINLLQTMRPAYSLTERRFCETYLEPVFGKPDAHGNYILSVGNNPTIALRHIPTLSTAPRVSRPYPWRTTSLLL